MIVVTGASGELGRRVIARLLETVPARDVTASVRDPGAVGHLADRGVRVVRADYTEAATLHDAFEGASRVLIVSSSTRDGDPVAQHSAAIDAARERGVERILYTSHMGAAADSPFRPMRTHAATEGVLARSGMAWTSLRHGYYTNTITDLLGDAPTSGRLVTPADGPVSWTDHDDLAEADVALLLTDSVPDGPTPPLTAPDALTFADVAAIVSDLVGRPVGHDVVDDEDWVSRAVSQGSPEPAARFLLTVFEAARRDGFSAVDPELGRLIGHPPRTVREVLAERLG
jgi:NAD(P)H dehydrogenase (quinone)